MPTVGVEPTQACAKSGLSRPPLTNWATRAKVGETGVEPAAEGRDAGFRALTRRRLNRKYSPGSHRRKGRLLFRLHTPQRRGVSDGVRTRNHPDHNRKLHQLSYAHHVTATAGQGLEPQFLTPEASVLPLHHPASLQNLTVTAS